MEQHKQLQVLYSFVGEHKHELSINEGEIVEIRGETTYSEFDKWYFGRVANSLSQQINNNQPRMSSNDMIDSKSSKKYGIFPSSFVQCVATEVTPTSFEIIKYKLKLKSFVIYYQKMKERKS